MSTNHNERYRWLEFTAAFLLLAAGAASAWNSYQAARWSGVQAARYSRANALRVESAKASTEADVLRQIHLFAFSGWLDAYAAGDKPLERFYRERLPPELVPAFNKWIAEQPLKNPRAAPTPFQLPEYRLESAEMAKRLEATAVRTFDEGQAANENGDAYVLNSVTLALVLLFAGISQQFRSPVLKGALLCVAIAICGLGFVKIASFPVQ